MPESLTITQNGTYTADPGTGYTIVAINVDGGVSPDDFADLSVRNDITGDITLSTATRIVNMAFQGFTRITSISAPNATTIGEYSISGCNSLVSFSAPKITTITGHTFSNLPNLESVSLDGLISTTSGNSLFRSSPKLETIHLPKFRNVVHPYMFQECSGLETLVLPNLGLWVGNTGDNGNVSFNSNMFYRCSKLKALDLYSLRSIDGSNDFVDDVLFDTLIIRNLGYKGNSICSLSDISHFNGTPFASDGTGGTLYVPQRYISRYQNATNWSTILSYTNNQILPIEGSYYETHYADGSSVPIPSYTEIPFVKANSVEYKNDGSRSTWDTRYWGSQSYVDTNGAQYCQILMDSNNADLGTGYFCCQFFTDDVMETKVFLGVSANHYWSRRVVDGQDYYAANITLPDGCTAIRFSNAYAGYNFAKLYSVVYS